MPLFETVSPHVERLNLNWKYPFGIEIPVGIYMMQQQNEDYYLLDSGIESMCPDIIFALASFFDHEICKDYSFKQIQQQIQHFNLQLKSKSTQNNFILDSKFSTSVSNLLQTNLKGFCVTHFHLDHCGSLKQLYHLSNQSVPIYCHENEVEFIRDGKSIKQQPSSAFAFKLGKLFLSDCNLGNLPCQTLSTLFDTFQPSTSTAPLIDSSTSSSSTNPNSKWKCHNCPGHTPGSACYYHEDDKILLCGDAVMNLWNKLGPSTSVATPDPVAAAQNFKTMCNLIPFDTLLPSHDPSNGVPRDVVMKYISKMK